MQICDHRFRRVERFDGPHRLVCKLLKCTDKTCSASGKTFSPEAESALAPPRWIIDWHIFAWIGQRRFSRHWSVPEIRCELADSHHIRLSDSVLEDYISHYERMVAARHQDPARLVQEYADVPDVRLSIDGLPPEKGHETLYVVRELNAGLVWFATPLLSSAASEVEALFVRARQIATLLDKPVRCWLSDKQDAFLTGIAKIFPGVPHRLCKLHFVRALAADVTANDSHVKVQMRKKIRGLAGIERKVLAAGLAPSASPAPEAVRPDAGAPPLPEPASRPQSDASPTVSESASVTPQPPERATVPCELQDVQQAPVIPPSVVLDYCAAVRGILHGEQGSALEPTGLRMASALADVSASLSRCLEEKKGRTSTRT
jgi:hypothetical protein